MSYVDREALHDYYDERPVDEEREDARREAARDAADERCVTCADCGTRWDPGYHRATRTDPAWAEREECPACGSGEVWEALSRSEQAARTDALADEYEEAEIAGDAREKARINDLLEVLQ